MQLHSVKLDNYGGFWCVEPVHFNQIVQRVNSMDLAAHVSAQTPQAFDAAAQSFELTGGGTVAVIDIQGRLKKIKRFNRLFCGLIRQAAQSLAHLTWQQKSLAPQSLRSRSLKTSARRPRCGWRHNVTQSLRIQPQRRSALSGRLWRCTILAEHSKTKTLEPSS